MPNTVPLMLKTGFDFDLAIPANVCSLNNSKLTLLYQISDFSDAGNSKLLAS